MGRELLGAPKLYAEIRDPWRVGNTWRWYCSEYGTRLIEAEMRNFSPADEATCKRIEQDGRNGHWLCWKYIPRPDWKGAQLSIATDVRNRPTISQAWFGEGTVHFHDTPWEKTPTSADIMKGLRTLVVKEYRPAVITKGSNDLLVAETRMLE